MQTYNHKFKVTLKNSIDGTEFESHILTKGFSAGSLVHRLESIFAGNWFISKLTLVWQDSF